jgi:hypothetical protein
MSKTKNIILTAWLVAGIVEIIIGFIWTKTEWAAYVIRDKEFNLWAPTNIVIGIALVASCIWASFKLDRP